MFKKYFIFFFCIVLFFSYILSINGSLTNSCSWPTPKYKTITSYFGFRIHPITFKQSYHSGIDISAAEGTNIYSICDGTIKFIGFNGAYGYSIIVENNNYEILYAHVSPNFVISKGQSISQNQIIGNIGPKYIQDFPSNKYYDSNRQSH